VGALQNQPASALLNPTGAPTQLQPDIRLQATTPSTEPQPSNSHLFIKNGEGKVKADIALHGNPISELRDVTSHMGSHSVTCHPTQVNAPHLNPSHAGWYSI